MTDTEESSSVVPITPEIAAELRSLWEHTGVSAGQLLKRCKDVPAGLNASKISNWINMRVKTVPQAHLNFIIKEWQKLPQYEFLQITDEIRDTLLNHQKRTGVKPQALLRDTRKERPAGLTALTIKSWLNGADVRIRKDHLEYVLAKWEAIRDKQDAYVPYSEKLRNQIRKMIRRTGLNIKFLLSMQNDIPEGLSLEKINNWCSSTTRLKWISREHYEYLVDICEKYRATKTGEEAGRLHWSKDGRVLITEDYLQILKKEIERTQRSPVYVLRYCKTQAKPTSATVYNWLSGTTGTATPEAMEMVLKEYRKHPNLLPVNAGKDE